MDLAMRLAAAWIVTYFVSRAALRAPLPGRGLGRLALVHGLSAALVGATAVYVRWEFTSAPLVAVAQAFWFLLDRARGRGLTAQGSSARAACS